MQKLKTVILSLDEAKELRARGFEIKSGEEISDPPFQTTTGSFLIHKVHTNELTADLIIEGWG